jgi:hypothetical protein
MFPECLHVPWMLPEWFLNVHWMCAFPLNVHWIPECSLNVPQIFRDVRTRLRVLLVSLFLLFAILRRCGGGIGALWACQHSVNIQWTFSEHSVNIQWTYSEHSVNIQWTFSEHSVNIQWTISEQSVLSWAGAREPPSQLQEAL